jgi:hypothetical protein
MPRCDGGAILVASVIDLQAGLTDATLFYATDIHEGSLGKGNADDTLARAADIKGELLCIWGRQDPHIPLAGLLVPIFVSP